MNSRQIVTGGGRNGRRRLCGLLMFVCLVALAGCGGGSSNSASLAGNWQLTLTNTSTNAVKSESGFFLQSGSTLSGNVLLTGQTACSGVGSALGSVKDSNVSIAISQVGQTVNLTGTATGSSKMGGDYSILSSPCGNSQVGSWTADQVQPLTGNLQATFTSTTNPGLVAHFTGKVTQGQNTGNSTATLDGSMTSTDALCFSNTTISGQISGTAVVFNLLSTEGTIIGQYIGTSSLDATTITGTYDLFPQSPPTTCTDYGTGTVTVQVTASK